MSVPVPPASSSPAASAGPSRLRPKPRGSSQKSDALLPVSVVGAALTLFGLGACKTPTLDYDGGASVLAPALAGQAWHVGPDVAVGPEGTARFAGPLLGAFEEERAMQTLRFVDQFYRAPANDGYEAVVDHLVQELEAAGFQQGNSAARLQLEVVSEPMEMGAWTPLSAKLSLRGRDGTERTLHEFHRSGDADRTLLPMNADSADVTGRIALSLDQLEEGGILVTKANLSQVLPRAKKHGAAGVVSASLYSFNIDPSGEDRHLDAIQYRRLKSRPALPVMQISPRAYRQIELAALRDKNSMLHMQANVRWDDRPLRTVIATIIGETRPDEAVAVVSHIQEPGACDNASGVAGLLESVVSLTEALSKGSMEWPQRTMSFAWGDEFAQSRTWLKVTKAKPIAAISSDMTAEARKTGAIGLLERMPDPGAIRVLPPDAHTPWGASPVEPEDLMPNGFAVISRCAIVDVGQRAKGDWQTADHPWEGGSDHDVFNKQGVPAVLFWHFTDFTYHTSLDRLDSVDSAEMHRTQCAILAAALGVADAAPGDLGRYLKSLDKEIDLRVSTAEAEEDEDLALMWKDWGRGARQWLRNLCLGIDEPLPEPRLDNTEQVQDSGSESGSDSGSGKSGGD